MPRPSPLYPDQFPTLHFLSPAEFQFSRALSAAGALVWGGGYVTPMTFFVWPLRLGGGGPANPWGATGLEWKTASPPPVHNFEEIPVVTHEAYDYSTIMEEV